METKAQTGCRIETDEPGITLNVVRMDNSDDVPVFGKMYHVYAEYEDVRVLAYVNRFKDNVTATNWAKSIFPQVKETIIRDLNYARQLQEQV